MRCIPVAVDGLCSVPCKLQCACPTGKLTHSGAAVCKTPGVILICSQVLEPLTPNFKEQVSGPTSPPSSSRCPAPARGATLRWAWPLTRQHHLHQVALLDVSRGAHQLQEVSGRGVMFEEQDLVVKAIEATLGELTGGRGRCDGKAQSCLEQRSGTLPRAGPAVSPGNPETPRPLTSCLLPPKPSSSLAECQGPGVLGVWWLDHRSGVGGRMIPGPWHLEFPGDWGWGGV